MSPESFAFFADVVKRRSGVALTPDRAAFVESRLRPIAWRRGFRSTSELVRELQGVCDLRLLHETVAAMTTHDSAFFRDDATFAAFRMLMLPSLLRARAQHRSLRIWSAGSSTGQEAYSLAMILAETPELAGWNAPILATDIDPGVIARAEEGVFNEFDVQRGLGMTMLARHFRPHKRGWQVTPELRARVEFRVCNLIDCIEELGMFDVIFCRNVLIYFDAATKESIASRLARAVSEDGYLVFGTSETFAGATATLSAIPDVPGVYRKRVGARARAA
jgi:chemotaxis protein methyltransferase CheR